MECRTKQLHPEGIFTTISYGSSDDVLIAVSPLLKKWVLHILRWFGSEYGTRAGHAAPVSLKSNKSTLCKTVVCKRV